MISGFGNASHGIIKVLHLFEKEKHQLLSSW
jgi:hypothetical protein